MNGSSLAWGALFLALAVVVALLPGAASAPRVGVVALLAMLGLTVAFVGNASWLLRRTTRPEDYRGTCPVGASCPACGAFNLKPRTTCRACHAPVGADAPVPAEGGAEAL